ncbi:hypothetical protein EV639_106183 [Rathayibacter tanaceti]|uniref:Uncharacterized protein n=2 Tax=Rathayibacter tanaceti TaxID=1671680 RepID=A0ACD2XIU6_9MICO|nr:hypothetical protein ACH61_02200 [Rathayibacter tanaceti]TCO36780.1 hypothetical protein EV639_106183 [Rathayibacter tanaceti]
MPTHPRPEERARTARQHRISRREAKLNVRAHHRLRHHLGQLLATACEHVAAAERGDRSSRRETQLPIDADDDHAIAGAVPGERRATKTTAGLPEPSHFDLGESQRLDIRFRARRLDESPARPGHPSGNVLIALSRTVASCRTVVPCRTVAFDHMDIPLHSPLTPVRLSLRQFPYSERDDDRERTRGRHDGREAQKKTREAARKPIGRASCSAFWTDGSASPILARRSSGLAGGEQCPLPGRTDGGESCTPGRERRATTARLGGPRSTTGRRTGRDIAFRQMSDVPCGQWYNVVG